jgi:large subunit ribosomal protein L6
MKGTKMHEELEIPNKIEFHVNKGIVKIKGPKGEVEKNLLSKTVDIKKEENKIIIVAENATKREKTLIGTFKAHLKNMIKGVTHGYTCRLKICSGHFPMNVSISNNELIIKNFLGEKVPRTVKLSKDVQVKIDGQEITVTGIDKEKVGQNAANIEQLCRVTNRDRRIFQDGIYIKGKPE